MKNILIKQLQFEHWSNQIILGSMRLANPLEDRALFLFSHLLNVGEIWLGRIQENTVTSSIFQERTLEECAEMIENNNSNWMKYLESVDDAELERMVPFHFILDGSKRSISVADAIMHIVQHSSYHRGQIVTLLKGTVEALPFVTYIAFVTNPKTN